MEDLLQDGYRDSNRAFLQALLARGSFTEGECRAILAGILRTASPEKDAAGEGGDEVTDQELEGYLEAASAAASLFDYEIRTTMHQVSRQRIWALVNTTSDPQTQLATTYNAEEVSFIKRLLDAIFDEYNRPRMEVLAISEMQAVKLARPQRRPGRGDGGGDESPAGGDKGLKHSEVEGVMASLVAGGWLEKSGEGFFSLSPRALLELRPWLVETYNDGELEAEAEAGEAEGETAEWQRIKFCAACKELVTIGLRCSEPSCLLRLHDGCQEAYWRTQGGSNCPKCSRPWTGTSYVGERALTMTEAYQRGRRRGGGRKSTLPAEAVNRPQGLGGDGRF